VVAGAVVLDVVALIACHGSAATPAASDAGAPVHFQANVGGVPPSVTRVTVAGTEQVLVPNGPNVGFRFGLDAPSYATLIAGGPIEVDYYAGTQLVASTHLALDVCRMSCGLLLCKPGDQDFSLTQVNYQTMSFIASDYACLICDGRLGSYGGCT
jgi:hypothetical protein